MISGIHLARALMYLGLGLGLVGMYCLLLLLAEELAAWWRAARGETEKQFPAVNAGGGPRAPAQASQPEACREGADQFGALRSRRGRAAFRAPALAVRTPLQSPFIPGRAR